MTTTVDLDTRTALFLTLEYARCAADRALPRRKHNRPYAISSGYHSARTGRNVWIVMVGNAVLLDDGTMYDYARHRIIG